MINICLKLSSRLEYSSMLDSDFIISDFLGLADTQDIGKTQ